MRAQSDGSAYRVRVIVGTLATKLRISRNNGASGTTLNQTTLPTHLPWAAWSAWRPR